MADTDTTRTQDRVLPDTIPADERSALHEREDALRRDGDTTSLRSTVGLALSGGGIRSATFCIGLLRGLARNRVLPRLDYLSTVSGGGYAGAAFGRLVSALGLNRAQELLRRNDSMALAWLRRYGRYLTPRGARDHGAAFATYLRAGIAIHLEFGLMAMLVGCLVVLPHVLQNHFDLLAVEQWEGWSSVWWPLAAACWLLLVPGNLVGYWMLRDGAADPEKREPAGARIAFGDVLVILASTAAAVWIGIELWHPDTGWLRAAPLLVALLFALASVAIHGFALLVRCIASNGGRAVANAKLRNLMTGRLRWFNLITLLLLAAGAVDLVSWWLMNVLQSGSPWVYGSLGIGGVLLAVVRAYADPLQKLANSDDRPSLGMGTRLLDIIGVGVAVLLLVAWVTAVQWWVFEAQAGTSVLALDGRGGRLAVLAAVLLAWLVATAWNAETVNTSSMHNFYRARLTRAYLGVGNPERGLDTMPGYDQATAENPEGVSNVTAVQGGDDVALESYAPEKEGGPLHLINVCLNQTRGGQSGLYNADRKGEPLVASVRGLELHRQGAPFLLRHGMDTLGRWIAISGAAAAPGAGSHTTRGWALLLFLAGARLGYWLKVGRDEAHQPASRFVERFRGTKAGRLIAEATGRFFGQSATQWYLSDGGHFDNTGVHALLRRQLDFIILADCGADPQYQFADLENLVRKARLDFGADIEFYTHESAGLLPLPTDSQINILAPEDLRNAYTARGVLLARIRYAEAGGHRRVGTLLVVKPNLHLALDSDVLAYASRNPLFPQQPTSDQFFDEAQWESYHRLGEDFGQALHPRWLARIPGWSSPVEVSAALPPLRRLRFQPAEPDASATPFWRLNGKAAAIGATVGLGVLVTLLVPLMQVFDRVDEKQRSEAVELREMLDDARTTVDRLEQCNQAFSLNWSETLALSNAYSLGEGIRFEDASDSELGVLVKDAQSACGFTAGHLLGRYCPPPPADGPLCSLAGERRVAEKRLAGDPPTEPLAETLKQERQRKEDEDVFQRSLACSAVCTQLGARNFEYWKKSDEVSGVSVLASVKVPAGNVDPISTGATIHAASGTAPTPSGGKTNTGTPAGPAPPTLDASCKTQDGKGVILYVHVYDEAMRAYAAKVPWTAAGATLRMPGIENVVSTASLRKSRPPTPYPAPTLIVHDLSQRETCARAVASWLSPQVLPWYSDGTALTIAALPSRFKPQPGVIELWLPPVESTRADHRETSE